MPQGNYALQLARCGETLRRFPELRRDLSRDRTGSGRGARKRAPQALDCQLTALGLLAGGTPIIVR